MDQVVGVRFKKNCKIYNFSSNGIDLSVGDSVLVDTVRGIEFGQVIKGPFSLEQDQIEHSLKPVIRVATDEDKSINQQNIIKAVEAHSICEDKIIEHELNMKLLDTEYNFDNSKLIFYFSSDQRVDFRELVRELASIFKTRIELIQVGVRDEAKYIGALGGCGRQTCCSSFLCEFKPVTINMAKDQSFSLNPAKISGICGRLMCCLAYEHDTYVDMNKKMPKVGRKIKTPKGVGVVTQVSPLQELVRVKLETDDGFIEENYILEDLEN